MHVLYVHDAASDRTVSIRKVHLSHWMSDGSSHVICLAGAVLSAFVAVLLAWHCSTLMPSQLNSLILRKIA